MNWLKNVGKKITSDVHFYYLPKRIVAIIPKTALEYNTVLLNKTEDSVNIYLEFQFKDALDIGTDRKIATGREETPSDFQKYRN